ncbi:MAG: hypothetical protein HRT71_03300 [Flavobacteriales bacterium]|nr:hypothetical protein [Flavobacteriales bacterium]
MNAAPLQFPKDTPDVYSVLDSEPVYDASIHLIEDTEPEIKLDMLADFGYSAEEIATFPSPVAVGGPFPLLSAKGIAAIKEILESIQPTDPDTGNRASNAVGGCTYKSKFLQDLARCPELIKRMSRAAGVQLAPHSIPHMQMYINMAPEDITQAVDNWHIDSIDYDCIILLEDPASFEGGRFQYFRGTDKEAADIFETTPDKLPLGFQTDLPADKVVTVEKSNAGDVVCQQGAKVVHRAQRLFKQATRTTVVISFVPADVNLKDGNNIKSIIGWDQPGTSTELARHVAWRSSNRLNELTENLSTNTDKQAVIDQLKSSVEDVNSLIGLLEKS